MKYLALAMLGGATSAYAICATSAEFLFYDAVNDEKGLMSSLFPLYSVCPKDPDDRKCQTGEGTVFSFKFEDPAFGTDDNVYCVYTYKDDTCDTSYTTSDVDPNDHSLAQAQIFNFPQGVGSVAVQLGKCPEE